MGSGRHLLRGYACHHARRNGAVGFALLVSAVLVLAFASPQGAGAAGEPVSAWLTTGDRGKLLEQQSSFNFGGDTSSELVIDVNEHHRYQTMDGFGAALTDSSAHLISTKLSAGQRADLMNRLFSPSAGLGLNYLRIPAGASDFSLSHYTYDDTCCDLSDFSIAPDEAQRIPLVLQAKGVNPALRLMGSPWSAPAWMKTNGSLYRGGLKPEYVDDYAAYLTRFSDAWAARGAPLSSLTLGNEPQHKPADYPGMWLTPSDEIGLVNQLGPALQGRGVKILTLDHNWALAHYGADVLRDPAARQYVDGTAFHCYGGAPDYQSIVRDAHPDKEIHFTECSSGNWATNWADNLVWDGVNLVVGATRNWARTVLKWNLALDPSHGPHTGGCAGCTGLVTIDPGSGSVSYNHDYYALGHVSKFVSPGAQRIASTARAGDLHSVAFRNPDGSKVLVVVNAGGQGRGFLVRWGGQAFQASLDKQSIATFRWTGAQGTPSPASTAAPVALASDGKVSLKWDFSPHATSYDVRRSAAGGPWTTVATGVALPEYFDTDVVNGTTYAYAVVAVNSVGRSADSPSTSATPGPPPQRSATSQLEAESFEMQSGVGIEPCSDSTGCGRSVGYTEDGDYLAWNQVHFGDGATSVSLRVASGGTGGSIELRLGSPTGTLIGSVPVAQTGGWGSWTTLTAPVSGASGVQSLYVVFRGPPPDTAPDGIANLNWLTFTAGGVPPAPGGPLPRTGWSATASPSGGETANALDGNPATRWTSGQGQANGHWFRVDLGSQQSFARLQLDSGTGGDYARGLRVEVSADGASWTQVGTATGSGQFIEVAFAAQTARYVRLVQTGSAGNWWSIHELELFAPTGPPPPPPPDTTAPSITLGGPVTGTQQTSATFTFSANEPAAFRCRLDAAGFDACASGIAYSGLQPGQHVFEVEATDAAGNIGAASHTWTIAPPPPPPPPDTTPPAITLAGPANGTQQTSATFTFSANEPATFRCRLDTAGFAACASGIAYSGLQPGEHVFEVEATDAAGNTGTASHAWTIVTPPPPPPDSTAPSITLSGPSSGTQQTSATFAFSANEPATFRCRLDAAGFDACASGIAYSGLQPGEHVFHVEATDAAGNTGAASHTWTIASPPPPPPPVVDTGLLGPLASSADTGGDSNGFQTSPSSAHADDAAFAVDTNSGSGTSTSCTSSSKDRHRFRDYGIALPGTASIKGIVVRLDARADSTSGSPKMCVQLSWNGGASWTSAKTTSTLSTSEKTYLVGGATNTWGRSWSAQNLGNASFLVRVVNIASSTSRDFSLDWVAVKVHYTA